MIKSTSEIRTELAQYTCTDNYYKHSFFNLRYTDGIKYLVNETSSYWLLDIIGSITDKIKDMDFVTIKLIVKVTKNNKSALFTADDGNGNIIYKQKISFTDFPLDDIKLFYSNGVVYLPSEH